MHCALMRLIQRRLVETLSGLVRRPRYAAHHRRLFAVRDIVAVGAFPYSWFGFGHLFADYGYV